jgi:ferredoxin-nitrate reductase
LARNIGDGQLVEITNRRGNVRVKQNIQTISNWVLCFFPCIGVKFLNNDLTRANNLTNKLVDPVSKEPDFKFSAVQVAAYKKRNKRSF